MIEIIRKLLNASITPLESVLEIAKKTIKRNGIDNTKLKLFLQK